MDIEQEHMQFLGFVGCYQQSFKLISSGRKIFSKITLTLIIPLSFFFLLYREIYIANKIEHKFLFSNKFEDVFRLSYMIFLLILSLPPFSAIVYTTALIYTDKDLSFKKVMSVVPKAWETLMPTFRCANIALCAYSVYVITLWMVTTGGTFGKVGFVLGMVYCIGLVFLTSIWQLASVVSVLEEDSSEFKAVKKSLHLIKGKIGLSFFIVCSVIVCIVMIWLLFEAVVVDGSWTFVYMDRTAYGILILLLLSCVFLFGFVLQTVVYFVCKSYHHENIDKSALAFHLGVYLGEYVPLIENREFELQQF